MLVMDDLTPSEIVLLNGERFAEKRLMGNVRLLRTDRKVAADQLAQAILTAAFLSNEKEDAIRFETGELSRWFGLRSRTALFVEPADEPPSWPRYTFEWAIPTFLEEIRYREGPDRVPVAALVDAFFDGDKDDPWKYVIDGVKDGLSERGLLERRPERLFRLQTGRIDYVLPDATAQLVAETSPEPVERLFSATGASRSELWELLRWEIDRAVSARLATDTGYHDIHFS